MHQKPPSGEWREAWNVAILQLAHPAILALGTERQEDHEFKIILSYIASARLGSTVCETVGRFSLLT
ncbi:hypothetical protein ACQP3F_31455, partial [Escherichia coli]